MFWFMKTLWFTQSILSVLHRSRTYCWCKSSFRSQTWLFVDNFWFIIWNCKCHFRFKDISFNLRVIEFYKENAKSHYHVPYQNHLWFPYILHIFVLRQQEVPLPLLKAKEIKKTIFIGIYLFVTSTLSPVVFVLQLNKTKPLLIDCSSPLSWIQQL